MDPEIKITAKEWYELLGNVNGLRSDLRCYIKSDTEWKNGVDPTIQILKNITGTSKMIITFVAGIGVIVGTIVAVKNFIKW